MIFGNLLTKSRTALANWYILFQDHIRVWDFEFWLL